MTSTREPDPPCGDAPEEGEPRPGTPSGFAIAVSVVSVMFIAVAAMGIGLVIRGGHERAMPVAPGGAIELASMPQGTAEHYRFAAAHPNVYDRVPCYCGCDEMLGHRSLLDCFVRPEGGWERHASGCQVCLDESAMIRSMLTDGSSAAQIRSEIVAAYTTTT